MNARRFLGVLATVASIMIVGVPGSAGAAGSGISVGAAKPIPHALTLFDLSCPPGHAVTHSTCGVALQTDFNPYGISLIHDGVPGPARVVPPNGIAIDCPTRSICVLADRGGVGWVVNGQSAGIIALGGMDVLNAIACPSISRCIAVGNSGYGNKQHAVFAILSRGEEFSNARKIAGATFLNAIACRGGHCEAVGDVGQANQTQHAVVVPFVNDVPKKVHVASALSTLANVSCGSSSSCYAVGNSLQKGAQVAYVLPIAGGRPRKPLRDGAGVTALSCWTATDCLGINNQSAARLHGGKVVATKRVKVPSPVQHVSCPTATGCLVSGGSYSGRQDVAIVRP
ncbi:MAG TPA: hypothetical protein VHW74_07520 [Mycobacteriales bacterium]|nr:hypothetical protein [Mycobacteriales bacterium]